MSKRINIFQLEPEVYKSIMVLENYVVNSGISKTHLELIKIRASQINGCAFCLNHHIGKALTAEEDPARMHLLSVWRETVLFTPREQAALAWTESVTEVAQYGVSDELFATVREQFSERELMYLTLALVGINGWNRLCIATLMPPGTKMTDAQHS